VHREVGNRWGEGLVLGNLGSLREEQGRLDAAREHYERALHISLDIGNRRLEGMVLGLLGALAAQQAQGPAATTSLERGEALLREVGDRLELGRLICARGHLHLRQGHRSGAVDALTEAAAHAQAGRAGAESELGRAIAALRDALDAEGS